MERDTMSPISVLARQSSSSSRTPDLSPIRGILEIVSDSSREAETESSRGKLVKSFFLYFILTKTYFSASSRERDSSPFYRRKVSKLPGRSPKKRVVKSITNDLRKSRPRFQYTSATESDHRASSGPVSGSERETEKEKEKKTDGSSGLATLHPPRKKVKLTFEESSEGFLSDIDDILKGDVTDPETHPMKAAIFSAKNPHLDDVMARVSEKEDIDVGKPETNSKQKRTKSKFDEAPKLKSNKKKVPVKKHSQQRVVIQKKTSKKFADDGKSNHTDNLKSKKNMKKRVVRMMPLSERQIFHGRNWIPVSEDREEERDCDYDWISKFSQMRLEDIADINRGEKKMMIMWNLHLQTYKKVGIREMDIVVMEFIDVKKEDILKENLIRNFMSHLCNLQQAGVLSLETFLSAVSKLQESITSEEMSGQDLTRSWSSHFPRPETSLLSPSQSSHSPSSTGPSSSSPSAARFSPHSRGLKIMNLSLNSHNSHKCQDGAKKMRLSPGSVTPTSQVSPRSLDSDEEEANTGTKKPRLSDTSSNSSRGSLMLQLSESSFSSHSDVSRSPHY